MRGPYDHLIDARATGEAAAAGAAVAGGKALLRLLHALERRGLTQLGENAIEAAVSPAARAPVVERASRFTARAPGADAPAPADALSAELARAGRALGTAAADGTPVWRSLGPWAISNGQSSGASLNRIDVSGRISAIAIDPNDPRHVLCGAGNGGVWESRNRGASWSPRTDFAVTTAVGALIFDPHGGGVAYCGTGEGPWATLGAGILRSADGGTTWTTLCEEPFVGQGFYELRVDPANASRLLAGTTGGLHTSSDGGVTWTQRRGAQTWSISFVAGADVLAATADGLLGSSDGGTTWAAIALPGAPARFNRLAVSIAPSNPAVAYAWGANDTQAFLWRRSGGAWSALAVPADVNVTQAWYDWYVAAAPDTDARVYCGAVDAYRGELNGAVVTWTGLSSKGPGGNSIHPDQHAIAFEPGKPDTIYDGCDGGLFRSPDRGMTWQSLNDGLIISEFEYVAQDPGSSRAILGGLQDNGTVRWTGAAAWEHVADGDGGHCGYNHADPRMMFHTFYDISPQRSSSGGDFTSWAPLSPPVPTGEESLFYPPLRPSATTGSTVAIGGGALYFSRDNGSSWVRLAFPGAVAKASALAIPNGDVVFAATTDGRLFRTAWNGTAWPALVPLATPRANAYVSDLFADPVNLARVWATYSTVPGGVFRSDDGGAHWTDCSAGLPNLPMNSVAVDVRDANRVWVAADRGVYQSLDAGANWSAFANGLPNALVSDLAFHPHAWVLRAGTRSRGMWEVAVDGWTTAPDCGVQLAATLAAKQTQRFGFDLPATWTAVWTVMPTGFAPNAQATYAASAARTSAETATHRVTVTNLTPAPLALEIRFAILSRY